MRDDRSDKRIGPNPASGYARQGTRRSSISKVEVQAMTVGAKERLTAANRHLREAYAGRRPHGQPTNHIEAADKEFAECVRLFKYVRDRITS